VRDDNVAAEVFTVLVNRSLWPRYLTAYMSPLFFGRPTLCFSAHFERLQAFSGKVQGWRGVCLLAN
jgi:hypothetical protein